jgi:hypothetical protein
MEPAYAHGDRVLVNGWPAEVEAGGRYLSSSSSGASPAAHQTHRGRRRRSGPGADAAPGPGRVVVLGDNPDRLDSRRLGPVLRGGSTAKVVLKC